MSNAVLARDFTVPAAWTDGNVYLHVSSWVGSTFLDQGRALLDDQELRGFNSGPIELVLNDALKPGSKHKIALEVKGGPLPRACADVLVGV